MPHVGEKPPWSEVPLEKSSSDGFRLGNGSVKFLLPPQAHSFGGRMCWRDSPADYDGDECEPDAFLAPVSERGSDVLYGWLGIRIGIKEHYTSL